MPAGNRTRDIFDFFGLPRELRDFVYEYSLTGSHAFQLSEDARDDSYLSIRADHLPVTNLLLVNRQFREEYADAANGKSALVMEDHLEDVNGLLTPKLPQALHAAVALHVDLYASCLETGARP